MKRIKRFGVIQTAKVAGVIYFLIAAVFMVPFGLITLLVPNTSSSFFPSFGGAFFIFLPFFYGIAAFIMTAIGCLVYNAIAKWIGGIEIEVEES